MIPRTSDALWQTLKQTHGRYASYWNARESSSGHVWQGRFYSCPLDDSHLWTALRYVELNPVRAGMVPVAEDWRWSSAAAHCVAGASDKMLEMERWQKRWSVAEWREHLAARESATDVGALRQCTHTGRPLGTSEFVARLEQTTSRPLAPRKGGRPKTPLPIPRKTASPLLRKLRKLGNVPSVPGLSGLSGFIRGTSRLSPVYPPVYPVYPS